MPDVYITINWLLFKIFPNKKKRLLNFWAFFLTMVLYILKWVVGMIVLAVGLLFGLSIALNAKSSDVYMISGATMIAISFMIVGGNIFVMGTSDMKKKKEIKKNKELLSKAEVLSSKKRIDSYRNIR